MSTEVVGDTAYDLIYKDDDPLTDAQAEALVTEYAKLGLRYRKCTWKGHNCVVTKAPAAEYKRFLDEKLKHWQSIRERVGYSGSLVSMDNTYQRGSTSFSPGPDWQDVVAFIDANFQSGDRSRPTQGQGSRPRRAQRSSGKKWWQFWK